MQHDAADRLILQETRRGSSHRARRAAFMSDGRIPIAWSAAPFF